MTPTTSSGDYLTDDTVLQLCQKNFTFDVPGITFVAKPWIDADKPTTVTVELRAESNGGSWLLEYIHVGLDPATPRGVLSTVLKGLRKAAYEQCDFSDYVEGGSLVTKAAQRFFDVGFGPTPTES